MNHPVVSIITPSFNRADIVHETAESIFRQTYPYWEWVIVDDGSTDDSWNVLQTYANKDQRVKIYKRDREPKGACTCRNIAVERSTGEFVLFLDTDDLLASFCLQQRVAAMQRDPGQDFIIFPMLLFKKKTDDTRRLWNTDNGADDLARILYGDPVCQGTGTIWNKKSFERVGMWDEKLMLWQDIELHIRSLLAGCRYNKRLDLPPDIFLRETEVSLSRTGFHSLPKLMSRIKVFEYALKKIREQGLVKKYTLPLQSMYHTIFLNAVKSGHIAESKKLQCLAAQYGILSPLQRKISSRMITLHKYKLYKIPVLYRLLRNGDLFQNHYESTLGQVPYPDQILD